MTRIHVNPLFNLTTDEWCALILACCFVVATLIAIARGWR